MKKDLIEPIKKELHTIKKDIFEKLKSKNNNYELYLVGGTIRDLFLEKNNHDFDLTWNISTEEFKNIIGGQDTEKLGTVFYTIVLENWNKIEIEYTPFRKEGKYNGRKPEEIIFEGVSLEEDAWRRDFTVNQLYLSIDNMNIIDPNNWYDDLIWKEKIVKAVGNPNERFEEDYLRILRWIRLKTKIWKNSKYDKKTYKAMIEKAQYIKKLSIERIIEEIMKWLKYSKDYINNLDNFNKQTNVFNLNIKDTFNSMKNNNLNFSLVWFLYQILGRKPENIKKMPNSKDKKIFLNSLIIDWIEKLKTINTEKELLQFLIDNFFNTKEDNKYYTLILNEILNLLLIDNQITKEQALKILKLKKEIDKKYSYTLEQYKNKNNINIALLIQSKWLQGEWIKKYFKKEMMKEFF